MTRTRAIKELKERIELIDDNNYPVPEYREVLVMAVDALENKTPCSVCRFMEEENVLCAMCPAMPFEKGETE